MVQKWRHAGIACLMVVLSGCAAQAPKKPVVVAEPSADEKEVLDGVRMIESGQIQAAIDGPLTDVINRYETKYAHSPDRIYSARGPVQSLLYLMAAAADMDKGTAPADRRNTIALGPAWAMAYWARGYAYSDMARYPEAEAEVKKALALSPNDAQYTGELAYIYQAQKRTEESLALYTAMPDMIPTMDGWSDTLKNEFRCKALRGQGYDLVELKRYDEAVVAYKACMKIIPGEPKSKAEVGYIESVRRKGG
jgi:tetratricopeptide (TPR) repeat protein